MRCLIFRDGSKELRFPVPDREVTVGAASDADLVVPLDGVSRRHARLVPTGKGLRLVDLDSRNGLWADGRRVAEARLEPGGGLRLGRVEVSLENLETEDVALGIRVERGPEPRKGRASHPTDPAGETGGNDAGLFAASLRLVRDLARMAPAESHRRLPDILDRTRLLLEADTLFVGSRSRAGDLAIEAISGPPPAEGTCEELERLTASRTWTREASGRTQLRLGGSVGLVFRPGGAPGPRFLVALLPPGAASEASGWRSELLACVGTHLVAAGSDVLSEAPGAPAPDPGPLAVPAGMVLGTSAGMGSLLREIEAMVQSSLDVLLLGETGTGKELLARLIHASGTSASGPFVPVNCAAIPSELLESELFGVQGRVATGVDARPGRFLLADGGSIFLDEVGELLPAAQAKLLRFLQEREVHPVGAASPRKVSVRVISATNQDLSRALDEGRFRRDLYYRLRGVELLVPPLRERPEDIPRLVLAFTERTAARAGKVVRGVTRRALALLLEHDWPGNVRELESEIGRAVFLCHDGGSLGAEHFETLRRKKVASRAPSSAETASGEPNPVPRHPGTGGNRPSEPRTSTSLRERLEEVERVLIQQALEVSHGNLTRAAGSLGVTRGGLRIKLRRLLPGAPRKGSTDLD